jgi:uncharacterized protein YkwD
MPLARSGMATATMAAVLVSVAWPACAAGGASLPEPRSPLCPDWAEGVAAKMAAVETAVVERVNARRSSLRRRVLIEDARLDGVAGGYAEAMAASGRFAHRSARGQEADDRLRAAGIRDWDIVAENLARVGTARARASGGGRSPAVVCHDIGSLAASVEEGWNRSRGHRRNLTSGDLTHVGTGAAYDPKTGAVYVVQVYVRRTHTSL